MVIVADKNGTTDGVAYHLVNQLNVKYPIVLVSRVENYIFNDALFGLSGKPYILIDFVELGWDWDRIMSHKWGVNTSDFPDVFKSEDWQMFDEWVKNNPPVITFQRELLEDDSNEKMLPIVYPCFLDEYPLQLFEDFNNRFLEVINYWGLSHEYRKALHADIWMKAGEKGYVVCDNLFYLNNFLAHEKNSKKWLTMNIPHYQRIPMEELIKVNGSSKISISIAGAGRNCFRHAESPVNSVMLMWADNTAWHQKDWVHSYNCIKCEQGTEVETAIEWLNKPKELYEIYLNGVKTVDKFRFKNYIPYLEEKINSL